MGGNTINVLAIGRGTYSESLDLCLTARALGASEITFIGKRDSKILKYMDKINYNWGGRFKVSFVKSLKEVMKNSIKYTKICLTRYGTPLQDKMYTLKTYKNIVLIVPVRQKIADTVKDFTDFNISISSQPHTAAAAIAIFLHEFYSGRELAMHFENAKYRLVPSERGFYKEEIRG